MSGCAYIYFTCSLAHSESDRKATHDNHTESFGNEKRKKIKLSWKKATTKRKKKKSWNERNNLKKEKETTHQASKKGLMNDRTGFSYLYPFFFCIRFTAFLLLQCAYRNSSKANLFFFFLLLLCCSHLFVAWTKTTFGWIWMFKQHLNIYMYICWTMETFHENWCFECLIDHVFT